MSAPTGASMPSFFNDGIPVRDFASSAASRERLVVLQRSPCCQAVGPRGFHVVASTAAKPLRRSIPLEQHLLEAVSDGVATLTLNRPERLNALSTPIMDGLLEALPRLARDSAIGAIVLT